MPYSFLMARHKGKFKYKKQNSRFQALPVNAALSIGTLADQTATTGNLTAITDDFWCQSADLSWSMDDHTAGEGPLMIGVNNGDLTGAEITEALDAAPVSRSDIINRERARRPVRRMGVFSGLSTNEALFDGKLQRYPLKIYLAESIELEMFVFNNSGAALTTGTVINVYGTIYGEWR